jgi:dipeptidase E
MKRLLLISNSTNAGEPYLGWPRPYITSFLEGTGVKDILFVPYAGVNLATETVEQSYDVYEQRVKTVFAELGYGIYSIHHEKDPVKAVEQAEAIAVGGGNTFHLVYMLHKLGLMPVIRKRTLEGMHFMGWSAGANVACPTLRTTNDMPIIQPASFDTLNLVSFQINPHYLDANPEGHGGETRQQRIEEFLAVNRDVTVVGLREATLIQVEGDSYELKGGRAMRIFKYGQEPNESFEF